MKQEKKRSREDKKKFPSILKSTKQKFFKADLYGVDIESYNKDGNFYCGTVYSDTVQYTFYSITDFINFFKTIKKTTWFIMTNALYDFMGIFRDSKDLYEFTIIDNGSRFIARKSYVFNKKFYLKKPNSKSISIVFVDTLNFAQISLKELGKIINVEKLEPPLWLGKRKPLTESEDELLTTYNIQDAKISYLFFKTLIKTVETLGGSVGLTIPKTALNLFKNKYLTDTYYLPNEEWVRDIYSGFVGGRTEAFSRGKIEDCFYYDVRSLYPTQMIKAFPDPNSLRLCHTNSNNHIQEHEGMSEVTITAPYQKIPFLHFKSDKLLFCVGTFRGMYCHNELRYALSLGYKIEKVHKTYWAKKVCYPMKDFIHDLNDKRTYYKSIDSPEEKIVKLLMNSLFGKFGEKYFDKEEWIPIPDTAEEINKHTDFKIVGNYMHIKNVEREIMGHCIPLWASYTSAYARIHMHKLLLGCDPLYMDTDSIITKTVLPTGHDLGDLELEHRIVEGYLVKPKFYGFINDEGHPHIRIKGLPKKLTWVEFCDILIEPTAYFKRIMKWKGALRRKLKCNQVIDDKKTFDLEDTKREWIGKIRFKDLQGSKPRNLDTRGNTERVNLPGIK